MLVYTFRKKRGIQVDVQGEDTHDGTDGDQTPEGEVSETDDGSDGGQSPEGGLLQGNRRSVRVDDEVTSNFRA